MAGTAGEHEGPTVWILFRVEHVGAADLQSVNVFYAGEGGMNVPFATEAEGDLIYRLWLLAGVGRSG